MSEIKKKIKAVMFDLDGTLIGFDYQMSPMVKKALIELKKTGIPLAMNSGRPIWLSKKVTDELIGPDFFDYLFGCNGSEAYNQDTGEIDLLASVKKEEIEELHAIFSDDYFTLGVYDGDYLFINKDNRESWLKDWASARFVDLKPVNFSSKNPSFEQTINNDYPKVICLFDKTDKPKVEEFIKDHSSVHFDYQISGPYCMEIVPKGVSKAFSCQRFASMLSIDLKEILSFGDSQNDMGMIRCTTGVLLGHAPQELKKEAEYLTDSIYEDGVYTFLVKEGFIKKLD